LLSDKHFDRFDYALPTGKYDPRFYSKNRYSEIFSDMNRPRGLEGMLEKQEALNAIRIRIEETKNRNVKIRAKFEQEAYEIAIKKKVFASQAEIFDFVNWLKDPGMRPLRSEYSSHFLKIWHSTMLDLEKDDRE